MSKGFYPFLPRRLTLTLDLVHPYPIPRTTCAGGRMVRKPLEDRLLLNGLFALLGAQAGGDCQHALFRLAILL